MVKYDSTLPKDNSQGTEIKHIGHVNGQLVNRALKVIIDNTPSQTRENVEEGTKYIIYGVNSQSQKDFYTMLDKKIELGEAGIFSTEDDDSMLHFEVENTVSPDRPRDAAAVAVAAHKLGAEVRQGPPPLRQPVHPTRMRRGNTEEFAGVYTSAPQSVTDFEQLPLTTIESLQGVQGRVGLPPVALDSVTSLNCNNSTINNQPAVGAITNKSEQNNMKKPQ